jgi:DNA-binding transcriptional LysR family regulator
MSERISGINAFVTAAEAGSFALAAQRLHLSRSAVGKSIARLEERLGVRLFHRTTRSQSLTEQGQSFYERCARALAELDEAEAELAAGQTVPSGRLRVSVPTLFGRRCVAPLLIELAQRHPQLELEMAFSDRNVDLIEEGFDLAIRTGVLASSATLAARKLGNQAMIVCATPAYLAAHGTPQTMGELEQHHGLGYYRAGSMTWRFLDEGGRVKEVQMNSRLRFDDLETIAQAALAGLGITWLPSWLVAGELQRGELVRLLEHERPFSFELHALWPHTRHLPSKVRAAIDQLVAHIPVLLG